MIKIRGSAQRLLQIRSFPGREGALVFSGLCLLARYEDGLSIKRATAEPVCRIKQRFQSQGQPEWRQRRESDRAERRLRGCLVNRHGPYPESGIEAQLSSVALLKTTEIFPPPSLP